MTKWLKKVGDRVERDEPLYEVSTDKVDSEMPSPASGVLTEVLAAEGDTVAVGARIAVIGESVDGAVPAPAPAPVSAAPAPPPAPAAAPPPSAPAPPTGAGLRAPSGADAQVTSPVVRRILEDAGLEPSSIAGSGPGGTVTRRDAERAVLRGSEVDEVVAPTPVRRRMAEHMVASAATPQAFVALEADAGPVARLRALGSTTLDGVAVDPFTVVALAAIRALGEFELLNATLEDDGLVVHHSVNLGIVLGVDDGMLVPVIHAAGGLTLRALARRVADLKERTATRQLTTDDLLGATVTIAGAPSEHTLVSIPILIQPQVAIVSVGATRRVLEEDPQLPGSVRSVERIVLGCAFDHRVVETTYVARYLERTATLLSALDVDTER